MIDDLLPSPQTAATYSPFLSFVLSMIRKSKGLPVINGLSSIMLVVAFAVVAVSQRLTRPAAGT